MTQHEDLAIRFRRIRALSAQLCDGLEVEDTVVQTMADISPTKWHLGHTSWAFENFVLREFEQDFQAFHEKYTSLFNSYYNAVGPQWDRPRRGVLSRPTLNEVWVYREQINARMIALITGPGLAQEGVRAAIEVALQHEQQHQELMLTDIKHVFASNPLQPVYRPAPPADPREPKDESFLAVSGGVVEVGRTGQGFSYDNESPRHRVFLEPFEIACDLVTSGEFLAFVNDSGYERPELWLDDGWAWVSSSGARAPLYWTEGDQGWREMRLTGLQPLEAEAPVCHVSFFEADAFARWRGARLPTEQEWEHACADYALPAEDGGFLETGAFHPHGRRTPRGADGLRDMLGEVWEWTSSAYHGYPGFRPLQGTLAEYNAKFMNDQHVLRGGSCATSRDHIRPSYRNFFQAEKRWQFTGIRLARDVERPRHD